MLVVSLMEAGASDIAKAVINAAKGGDLAAARLVLERLVPPVRERPISIALPASSTTEGIGAAQDAILLALGAGELLPGEAAALVDMLDARRRTIETQDLEQRVAALEKENAR